MRRLALVLLLALLAGTPALAVMPDEVLADPTLELRAREISKELRCLVCQNQSIDDSDAALARDLRIVVRERLTAGDSDAQVVQYLVERYGDYVLLRPPVKAATLVLWGGPFLILGAALLAARSVLGRRRGEAAPVPLDEAESRRFRELMGSGGRS